MDHRTHGETGGLWSSWSRRSLRTAAGALLLAALLLAPGGDTPASVGTPPPFFCGKTYVFAKAVPNGNVVAGEASAVFVQTLHYVNLIEATFGSFCPALPASVELSAVLECDPGPSSGPTDFGPFALGEGFTTIPIEVPVPAGPPRECTLVITATVSFSDGSQLQQTADQRICVLEAASGSVATGLPALEVHCVNGSCPIVFGHPSDQRTSIYEIINNTTSTFQGALTVECRSTAGLPLATAGPDDQDEGAYSVGDPQFGGACSIGFAEDVDGCLPLPAEPHLQQNPTISMDVIVPPGSSVQVPVLMRSHRSDATGTANEVVAVAKGLLSGTTRATACAGSVLAVDDGVPADLECLDSGRVASGAAGVLAAVGPAARLDADASPTDNEDFRLNFVLVISSMEMQINGQPISGGTPDFSGVTQVDGNHVRLVAEFSFISPLAGPDARITMLYVIRIATDGSSPHPVTPTLRSVAMLPGVPAGFENVAPVISGEVEVTNKIDTAYLQFQQQLSAVGVEQGDFSSVAMTSRNVFVEQLNDTDYLVVSEWTATQPGQDPMIGFDVSNDFGGFAMRDTLFQACCTPHLSCLDVHEGQCLHMKGEPQGFGADCVGTTCPPQVPCCFISEGTTNTFCTMLTAEECMTQGGLVSMAPDCEGKPCPLIGACCFIPNGCEITFEELCTAAGGVFMGPETTCDYCETLELGACCLLDGGCIDTNNVNCAAMMGIFQGPATICISTECPEPTPCCLEGGFCFITEPVLCVAQGGLPVNAASCSGDVCQQLVVCCDGGGMCSSLPADQCAAAGGTTFNDLADCTLECEAAVACCLPSQLPCVVVHPDTCAALGGFAVGSACEPGICDEQACCLPGGTCVEVTVEQCRQAGGSPRGAGSSCPGGIAGAGTACPLCSADVSPDGEVNVDDLVLIILDWGCFGLCPGDINADLNVDVDDLLHVILQWGQCDG